ncbi:MAG: hypothetical protein AAFR65_15810 [Pseudomonadota bacterium]
MRCHAASDLRSVPDSDGLVPTQLEETIADRFAAVTHNEAPPDLPRFAVALCVSDGRLHNQAVRLAALLRSASAGGLRLFDATEAAFHAITGVNEAH